MYNKKCFALYLSLMGGWARDRARGGARDRARGGARDNAGGLGSGLGLIGGISTPVTKGGMANLNFN